MGASTVCPGDRLFSAADYAAGSGTYVKGDHIYSSLVGTTQVFDSSLTAEDKRPVVEVLRSGSRAKVPEAGNIVIAKVNKVNPRLASASLLCVNTQPLNDKFSGIIRQQDVRATEIDKVELYSCFRPGDLVRAEVISLGDSRSYYLSTAKNNLGVVYAKSLSGVPMIPLSWQEMQCPETKVVEKRKVAKVN
ncbi:Exosome complex component CSL4 [Coccomyxa sp. Obi]|nr:Exosome complex component CSL4 [Coccomyxa sp. Obi]